MNELLTSAFATIDSEIDAVAAKLDSAVARLRGLMAQAEEAKRLLFELGMGQVVVTRTTPTMSVPLPAAAEPEDTEERRAQLAFLESRRAERKRLVEQARGA